MEKLAEVCKASDDLLLATPYKQVDVTDTANVEEATRWWEELTSRGGEGITERTSIAPQPVPAPGHGSPNDLLAAILYSFNKITPTQQEEFRKEVMRKIRS